MGLEAVAAVATKSVMGRILVVQEMRFRLVSEDGRGYLFTLAHNANVDSGDLRRYQQSNLHVIVEYEGEPNLESGIARRVRAQ